VEPFFFDRKQLLAQADQLTNQYVTAAPFPHVMIDGFLPEAVIRSVAGEFPTPEAARWQQSNWYFENKLSTEDEENFPPHIRQLMYGFNSSIFTEFLERLTQIKGLIPDPHFRGGGLHQIRRDGKLGVHCDFNFYERLKVHRRINVLLYLNEAWPDEYGGHLELWDREMKQAVQKIAPVLNRCVIFSTTDQSFHGHPDPLRCPEGVTRKSLALYYYSAERPESELSDAHTTLFQARPGEVAPAGYLERRKLRNLAKSLLPRSVVKLVRSARSKM